MKNSPIRVILYLIIAPVLVAVTTTIALNIVGLNSNILFIAFLSVIYGVIPSAIILIFIAVFLKPTDGAWRVASLFIKIGFLQYFGCLCLNWIFNMSSFDVRQFFSPVYVLINVVIGGELISWLYPNLAPELIVLLSNLICFSILVLSYQYYVRATPEDQ